MKKISALILAGCCLFIVLFSCEGSCNCSRDVICARLTATNRDDNSIVEKKIYCSNGDYRNDVAFQDSIGRFYQRHYSDNSIFLRSDTTLASEYRSNVKTRDVQAVENNGFLCNCSK